MSEVKRQLANFCAGLPVETAVRVFVFDQTIREGPHCGVLDKEQREKLNRYFESLNPVGSKTHAWRSLDYVLERARQAIAAGPPGVSVKVLLFTDGEDNDPTRPDLSSILAKYATELKDRIEASYITLGFTLSSELVRTLQKSQIKVLPALRPADIIPLTAGFAWTPFRPTAQEDEVEFTDQTRGLAVSLTWIFGDGATSSEKSPKHVFLTPGEKAVMLVVTDQEGQTNSITKTIIVSPPLPLEPRFTNTPPNDIPAGSWVQFVNLSTGPVAEILWGFGDGEESREEHPAHKYLKSGRYTVTLTLKGPQSDSKSDTTQLRVLGPPPPTVEFHALGQATVNEPVQFIDRSAGLVDERYWDFGDGLPPAKERDPVHTYVATGDYTVSLTCRGPGGQGSNTAPIRVVRPPPPVANFEPGVLRPRVGDDVKFVDTSSGLVVRARWTFADVKPPIELDYSSGAGHTIVHRCASPGTNLVALEVWGPGGSDKKQIALDVLPTNRPPRAVFEPDGREARGSLTVRFLNKSEGTIRRCVWNFGDGSPELLQNSVANVEHTFSPGVHTVALTVYGAEEFAPSRYTCQPIVVKRPWPRIIRQLPWAAPATLALLLTVPLGIKWSRNRRLLRDLSRLSGVIKCGPAGSPPSKWKAFPVTTDSNEFVFRPLEVLRPEVLRPDAADDERERLLTLRIKKIVDRATLEESIRLEVRQDAEIMEFLALNPGEDVYLESAGYALRYEP